MTKFASAILAATLALACSACSGNEEDRAIPSTTSTRPTTTVEASTSTEVVARATPAADDNGCQKPDRGPVPEGFAHSAMGDIDADGRADTFYLGLTGEGFGHYLFGVVTASGIRTDWEQSTAGGGAATISKVVDVNEDGRPEVFVSPSRVSFLLTYEDCMLQPYLDASGSPLEANHVLGFGFGCFDADGDERRDLVLNHVDQTNDVVPWTRTVVTLSGTDAREGVVTTGTYQEPQDHDAIRRLLFGECEASGPEYLTTEGLRP